MVGRGWQWLAVIDGGWWPLTVNGSCWLLLAMVGVGWRWLAVVGGGWP